MDAMSRDIITRTARSEKHIMPTENVPYTTTWADVVMQNIRNSQQAMPQHTTETITNTCP